MGSQEGGKAAIRSWLGNPCRRCQEERAWSALLRAAGRQGPGEAFESDDWIAVQSFVRHSRKAEAAVVLRLRSDCGTYEPLHDIVGDRPGRQLERLTEGPVVIGGVGKGTFAEASVKGTRQMGPERARGRGGWTTGMKVTVQKA